MRNNSGVLIGDIGDGISTKLTEKIVLLPKSIIDENQTTYTLLPIIYNEPPTITKSIVEASIPPIKKYPQDYRDPFPTIVDGQLTQEDAKLYKHSDGNIKVVVGSSFTLRVEAKQPNTLNIENGIPTTLPINTKLIYNWFKDNVPLTTSGIDSSNTKIIVNNNTLTIENIVPLLSGDYFCEISNDTGVIVSDTVTFEIYDTSIDNIFNTNLIVNPNGEQGTSNWESLNGDFTTEGFTKESTKTLLEPNRVNVFGYNADTMHPRPYQIGSGEIKNLNYTKSFVNNPNSAYFTRTQYKYENNGGTLIVKAYQDIDLTDVLFYIRGGVYGVSGIRALFGCYIGNAINGFVPTGRTLASGVTNNKSYFMERPRISAENFVYAGSAQEITEQVYVTIEELNDNVRVPSTILNENNEEITTTSIVKLMDPWSKALINTTQYYNGSGPFKSTNEEALQWFKNYGVPATPNNHIDKILFAAEKLYPNRYERYTYGQYVEFNKVVLSKLNDKTTKIRITLNYETQDPRITERWIKALDSSDLAYEFLQYQGYVSETDSKKFGWDYTGQLVDKLIENSPEKDINRFLNIANPPRGMITGLTLSLIPIFIKDKATTDYNTATTLNQNNTPKGAIPIGLVY